MNSDELIFRSFFALLVFVNVLGNSLVILVILKSRSMKTPINYLLLNLAVADLMVGVFVVPQFVIDGMYTHPGGTGGDVLCKLITKGNLAWLSTIVSIFSLVLIAFERYYAIMKPLSIRHRITTRKLKIFIPICWTLAVIRRIPQFYFGKVHEEICRYAWPTWVSKLNIILRLVVVGLIPTSIMAVLYSRIVHRLWFQSNDDKHDITFQAVRRSRKKVTKMMLTLSVIYVFCWFPDLILHVSGDFLNASYPKQLHDAFRMLMVLNSTVNPIVYAFQFEEFRKGFRKIFCSTCMHVSPHNSAEDSPAGTGQADMDMKTIAET